MASEGFGWLRRASAGRRVSRGRNPSKIEYRPAIDINNMESETNELVRLRKVYLKRGIYTEVCKSYYITVSNAQDYSREDIEYWTATTRRDLLTGQILSHKRDSGDYSTDSYGLGGDCSIEYVMPRSLNAIVLQRQVRKVLL
jgi:hypothetical protein